jgi:hypothetical protein
MTRAGILVFACLLLAGCGSSSSSSTSSTSDSTSTQTTTAQQGTIGFEGVPIQRGPLLGDPASTGSTTVDGIKCQNREQLLYHIHSHLTVYVHGAPRALPGGIGIPGSTVKNYQGYGPVATGGRCIYWLHTHAPDGVIHVESPIPRIYTLGDFFDVWRQPLGRNRVASAGGRVTAIVNGKPWKRDPHAIPLLPHAVIQLSVGDPVVPFQPMSWVGLRL